MDALTITKDKNQGFECTTERFQEYHDKGGHSYCHSMRRTHKESRLVNNIVLSENKAFGYMKGHSGLGRTVMEVRKEDALDMKMNQAVELARNWNSFLKGCNESDVPQMTCYKL